MTHAVTSLRGQYDVAVVGAGPVGCVVALAFARKGAQVALFEGNPAASQRFAGEWIHPVGVSVLDRFRIGRLEPGRALPGYGFVILAEGTSPIELAYGQGVALTCEHHAIVGSLREVVQRTPAIRYLPDTRVEGIEGHRLQALDRHQCRRFAITADRIVGADGRSSLVRRHIGAPDNSSLLSYMASLELEEVTLPHEGFGHVLLGGPGPGLLYRVSPSKVRCCLDLPVQLGPGSRSVSFLWDAFSRVFPPGLRQALRSSIETRPVLWAANRFRPRSHFGQGHVTLVGDALGHVHPLTASGMTLGFLDAQALVESRGLEEYAEKRAALVPELVGNALYHCLYGSQTESEAIRRALLDLLRSDPQEATALLDIASGKEDRPSRLAAAFLRTAMGAAKQTMSDTARLRKSWSELGPTLWANLSWLRWPLATVVPPPVGRAYRERTTFSQPLPLLARLFPESGLPPAELERRPGASSALESRGTTRADRRPAGSGPQHAEAGREIEADWAYCQESLLGVSRTFSQPIGLLPEHLERVVTVGYLLCRVADTIEDHPALASCRREHLYDQFLAAIHDGAKVTAWQDALADVEGEDPALDLARNLDRVLRILSRAPDQVRPTLLRWISEMVAGMRLYGQRPPDADGYITLRTLDDLQRYCHFVAGTVGHMLTDLFIAELGHELSRKAVLTLKEHGESFGVGLQLVNIIKDVTDDRERGWCYLPETVLLSQDLGPGDLVKPALRQRAHRAAAPVFALARRHLEGALAYCLAIPQAAPEIRLFCLLPLWTAVATLRLADHNDALFVPEAPVKISRGKLAELAAECTAYGRDDAELRRRFGLLWAAEPAHARAG